MPDPNRYLGTDPSSRGRIPTREKVATVRTLAAYVLRVLEPAEHEGKDLGFAASARLPFGLKARRFETHPPATLVLLACRKSEPTP